MWKAGQQGLGKDIAVIQYSDPLLKTAQLIRRNILTFAAFKNYSSIHEMVDLLTDEHGKLRSFSAFKIAASKVYSNYGDRFLQTEYNAVVRAGEMANQWSDHERDKDIYPNLEYRTQEDNQVRQSHVRLNRLVKSIDDPFWDTFYPPNGWGCRCYTLQSDDQTSEDIIDPEAEHVPKIFRHNVGKNGVVFGEAHPYFEDLKGVKPQRIVNNMRRILEKEDIYDIVYQDESKIIKAHITHNGTELAQNIDFAKRLEATNIILLPQGNIPGKNYIDMLVDGQAIEYKITNTNTALKASRNTIQKAIKQHSNSDQKDQDLTLAITMNHMPFSEIYRYIGQVFRHKPIKRLILDINGIIYSGSNITEFKIKK